MIAVPFFLFFFFPPNFFRTITSLRTPFFWPTRDTNPKLDTLPSFSPLLFHFQHLMDVNFFPFVHCLWKRIEKRSFLFFFSFPFTFCPQGKGFFSSLRYGQSWMTITRRRRAPAIFPLPPFFPLFPYAACESAMRQEGQRGGKKKGKGPFFSLTTMLSSLFFFFLGASIGNIFFFFFLFPSFEQPIEGLIKIMRNFPPPSSLSRWVVSRRPRGHGGTNGGFSFFLPFPSLSFI